MIELQKIQNTLKVPNRKFFVLYCATCYVDMRVRSDYVKKHSGICMSCQKKGNKCALKHGENNTRLYRIWAGLFHRRGYKVKPDVCLEWKNYVVFSIWARSNGYKNNLTIDRIDNNQGYSPYNCQWITLEENSGKDKIKFNYDEKMALRKWRKIKGLTQRQAAKELNVSRNTIIKAEKFAKEMA